MINVKINLDTNKENTEDFIIQTDNSCFDEQSFFKSLNNNKMIEKKETEISKLSKYYISNIHNNNPQINNNLQNYENFFYSQSPSSNPPKTKNNNKIIKDFIERNDNYIKRKKNEEDEKNKEEKSKKEIKEKVNEFIPFQNFLVREKQFLIQSSQKKAKLFQKEESKLIINIQEKPTINKKSSDLALKKNKKKVFHRLYDPSKIAFSADKKNNLKNSANFNKKKDINSNIVNIKNININNCENNNFDCNKNVKKKKYSFKKRSKKDIKSLTSNNIYEKENNEKLEAKTPKNENNNSKNINFLSKNNSRKNININSIIKAKKHNYNYKKTKFSNKILNKINNERANSLKKYNNKTAKDKMRIFQMNKINKIIDNMLPKDAKENGINFYLFCELLFNLGFAYVLHENKNVKEYVEEYIKQIKIQPYINKSEITKEFIYKELIVIKDAFNSIINNFGIKSPVDNEKNNKDLLKNDKILIEDFKLFIFILSDIFEGWNKEKKVNSPRQSMDDIKPKNVEQNISTNSNKTDKTISKINHNNRINKIISKLLHNKQLEDFNNKDIINYRKHFKYLMDINSMHIIYHDIENKKIKKEQVLKKNLDKFTFIPKTNDNNDLILNEIKPNMNFEERNQLMLLKNNERKLKIKKEIENEFSQEMPFEPLLNGEKDLNYFKKVNKMIEKERIEKEKKEKKKEEEKKKDDINNIKAIKSTNSTNDINKISKTLLSKDKLLSKKIKELRNANFKKKLEYFEKNNREILLSEKMKKDKRFLNHFLNNVDEGRMCLGLERKTNKDNFDVFIKLKRRNKNNDEQNGCLSNFKDIISKKDLNNFYVFLVEININNKNNILEVRPNDNYEELCLTFCLKHGLGIKSYNHILESIKKKLDEIDGYSFNSKKKSKKV